MPGIDDIQLYLPKCYLPIETLSEAYDLPVEKLKKGLGLYNMAIPDADEDVVTMAGEALISLLEKNDHLDPNSIGRIYVGTESSIDGSKPIASYLVGIANQYFKQVGKDPISNCDAVDMVFACIGAVDAMENSLYWLAHNEEKQAIVIAVDHAKYELGSPGEYTQGAGAVAVLLNNTPRILEMDLKWGVSTSNAHDFYKPIRFQTAGERAEHAQHFPLSQPVTKIHNACPVFDGPISNQTYQDRMMEAYWDFDAKHKNDPALSKWEKTIFHLPYAFHGRRIFSPLFLEVLKQNKSIDAFCSSQSIAKEFSVDQDRVIRKTPEYQKYVADKIADGEKASMHIGNVYTASIFLCLLSSLYESAKQSDELTGNIGFIAYGSGAKSKVFQGSLVAGWKNQIAKNELDDQILERKEIDFEAYKYLHKEILAAQVSERPKRVELKAMGYTPTNYASREYRLI